MTFLGGMFLAFGAFRVADALTTTNYSNDWWSLAVGSFCLAVGIVACLGGPRKAL